MKRHSISPIPETTQQPRNQTWGSVLKTHPAADLLPLMSDADLGELGEDIKRHNLHTPIVIFTDQDGAEWLIDGRNRLNAMERIGLPIIKDGGLDPEIVSNISGNIDPFDWVLSANILRRHLTREQKDDVIAKLLKERPGQSNRTIAKQVKADHKTVGKVRDKLESTGEIPQLEKTKGKDGKERPARKETKLSPTKQWMQDHPDDKPCPGIPHAAAAWRRARGIMPAKATERVSKAPEVEQEKEPTEQSPEDSLATRIEGAFGGVRMLLGDESIWPPLNASREKRLKKALKQLSSAYRELVELAKPAPRRGRPCKADRSAARV